MGIWPYRLTVRTAASQVVNRGPIPREVTISLRMNEVNYEDLCPELVEGHSRNHVN